MNPGRPDPSEYRPAFERDVSLVPDGDLVETLVLAGHVAHHASVLARLYGVGAVPAG